MNTVRPKIIIVIAPLKISVDNLRNNFHLDNYNNLKVDSDYGGTTNEIEVKAFLDDNIRNNNNIVIYSTYKSAKNILNKLMTKDQYENALLVVDEVKFKCGI